MKNVKLYKSDIEFLKEMLSSYNDMILHFPYSHYRMYKDIIKKIKEVKEKLEI